MDDNRDTSAVPWDDKAMMHLISSESFTELAKIAADPATPSEALELLFESWEPDRWDDEGTWPLLIALARNPRTPGAILAKLTEMGDSDVYASAAINPSLPKEVLYKLAHTKGEDGMWSRQAIARNPASPPELLKLLASDPITYDGWFIVKMAVAENPQASPDVLQQLLADQDEAVGRLAALHPSVPRVILERIAKPMLDHGFRDGSDGYSPGAIFGVASNPNTPPEILERLAYVDWERFQVAVATNPSAPPAALAQLAQGGALCRQAVAKHPNTPTEVLEELAQLAVWDPAYRVLAIDLASNPNASANVLRTLSTMETPPAKIGNHPNYPPELLGNEGNRVE